MEKHPFLRMGGYAAGLPACFYRKDASLANPLPVATLLDSAGSSHRLTAPRYGLTSYCGRSLFTSEEDMRPSPQGLGKKRCCYAVSFPEDDGFALALLEKP